LAQSKPRTKRFALYWCTTPDGDEDWFVVADSAASARRFHENVEDYERGEANAERIAPLPASLVTPAGWRNGPTGKEHKSACWPSDDLLVACGGEIAPLPRDGVRDMMQIVCKDVRFGDRVFRAGDLIANMDRERGISEARLSVFNGRGSSKS
jgi:hypothetical protein